MKMRFLTLLVLLTIGACAQRKSSTPLAATDSGERMETIDKKAELLKNSRLKGLSPVNIGPTIMSGRVVDIDVNPEKTEEFFVAYASGGLWYTKNNGTSFTPVTDQLPTQNIGDIAVNWTERMIWLGTGENNSSRSSYAGIGLYLSEDFGESWKYIGLEDSHHIGRILLDPTNPSKATVAVLGHLYSRNENRGIYSTSDKGTTWQKTLYINDNTGGIDLVSMDNTGNLIYTAMWERSREAWDFAGNGSGSAVYESLDGGLTWEAITSSGNGFPSGPDCGRIGLTSYHGKKGQLLYALVDNQARQEKAIEAENENAAYKRTDFKNLGKERFLEMDTTRLEEFLRGNGFAEKYTAETIFEMVEDDKISPNTLYEYLTDANAQLFDTPVKGAEVYVYDRTEKQWNKTHEGLLEDVVFSYGYYFGLIRVHPEDPNLLYIAGVPLLKSADGGANWEAIQEANQHVDHHALWLDPNNPDHFINGNDGGINITWDNGETYVLCNSPSVGQFYTVAVDDSSPYHVYGGLQDNGVWVGPSDYEASNGWHASGKYPYEFLLGGDGMQIAVDTRSNETVYTGYQFGHYYRIDRASGDRTYFHPKHDLGERPLRWNWQTPIHLSIHNQDILYMASNKFHRSLDKGETWETLSGDLTLGGRAGNVPYGTGTTIEESPLRFGMLYLGTDDGKVWSSKDGGNSWKDLEGDFPANLWVSRVEASNHAENRVYLALNGYRYDHFDAYIYVSDNSGDSWRRIGSALPDEPVNVILEDPTNEDILYVGTDQGLYISMDRGTNFDMISKDFPNVAVHDLVYQAEAHDLVIGTHGRSIYRLNVAALQETPQLEADQLFALETLSWSDGWGTSWSKWVDPWEPEVETQFYNHSNTAKEGTLQITRDDVVVQEQTISLLPGLNNVTLTPSVDPNKIDQLNHLLGSLEKEKVEASDNGLIYLPKGSYEVTLNGSSQTWTIE